MAVITTANASTLKIKFDCGMDGNGDNIMRTSSYGYLKPDATNDDVMEVANVLVGLQKHDLEGVTKIDSTSLSE